MMLDIWKMQLYKQCFDYSVSLTAFPPAWLTWLIENKFGKQLCFHKNSTEVLLLLQQQAAVQQPSLVFYPVVETCQKGYSSRFQVKWVLSNYDIVQLVCVTLPNDKWLDTEDKPCRTPHMPYSCRLYKETALGRTRMFLPGSEGKSFTLGKGWDGRQHI